MLRDVRGLALYRLGATFRRRRAGYIALSVLVGVICGLAMASVAGARRTQSSFPAYVASTNPSDVQMFTAFAGLTPTGFSAETDAKIARIPHVRSVTDVIGFDPTLQFLSSVTAHPTAGQAPPAVEGSPNGDYLTEDRLTVLRGRLPDPARDDEIVMSQGSATEAALTIGSTFRVAFFTLAQESDPNFSGYPHDAPHLIVNFRLVGIVRSAAQVVQDDDAALGNQLAIISPSLTRRLMNCCAGYSSVNLQLTGGAADVAAVAAAVSAVLPPGLSPLAGHQTDAPLVTKAERAIRPEAIAFGVFGVIVAIAALLICSLMIGRLMRENQPEAAVLRALGAGPATIRADALLGVVMSVVAGIALAGVVAVALSPLAPIGPARSVYPHRGVRLDWAVLGLGSLVLLALLAGVAGLIAYRTAPHRSERSAPVTRRPSTVMRVAAGVGLGPSAVSGIGAALGGDRMRRAPVRSALVGGVLAVVVVVASVTFGASLHTLVARPPLYGWNWDLEMLGAFSAQENLPAPLTTNLLDHDRDVAQWTGISFTHMKIDGQQVAALATTVNPSVAPPLLSGHGLQAPNQVVLGRQSLVALHKHVGDTVTVMTGPGSKPVRLVVVGTATMPTIGNSGGGGEPLQMGTGAIVSTSLFSAIELNPQQNSIAGPMAVLVRLRPGVTLAAGRSSLEQLESQINSQDSEQPAGGVVSVLRPAEIANYRAVGSTPAILAAILAAGAIAAIGLTLLASVRGRRHEFAVLKTIGFTRRQLRSSVTWQATVTALVSLAFGLPLGIGLGRRLWVVFANAISAVPAPVVPAISMLGIAAGALVLANLVAVLAARAAATVPSAVLLRGE